MVLVIVSRNIDLSVGSLVGVIAMTYALLMTDLLPNILGIGPDFPFRWLIALGLGVAPRVRSSAHSRDSSSPTSACPSFIVTLGGLLSIRGVVWYLSNGAAVSGLDPNFQLLGGGAQGSIGGTLTWILGIVGCVAIVGLLINGRRQRRRYGFPLRPMWAEVLLGVVGIVAVLAAGRVRQRQPLAAGPRRSGRRRAELGTDAARRLDDPDRVPVPDHPADRRDPRDDLDRDPAAVRAVRVRLRRQPRRRRAGRHQHPLDDPEDVRPDGHPVRPRGGDRVGPAQRRDARHRPELRALRHRRGRRRRHLVRRRHRDHPGRRPRRVRHAVARLRA